MNKPTLSEIYCDGMRQRAADAALDADTIVAIASGDAAARPDHKSMVAMRVPLQSDSIQADLIRFARDLQPLSATLGADMSTALRDSSARHRRPFVTARATHGARRWRVASAIAASLLAVVAIWNVQRVNHGDPTVAKAPARNGSDRIFSGFEDRAMANNGRASDEIFNSSQRGDEIFSANHNDG